jgi:ribosome recycling factor
MPNLDASPQNDGNLIRVTLPDLTEERRKEYVKLVKAKAEDHRVVVRNLRRKGNDDLAVLKKDGEAGDDEIARAEKELDALTKTHVDAIDDALKRKEAELLEV